MRAALPVLPRVPDLRQEELLDGAAAADGGEAQGEVKGRPGEREREGETEGGLTTKMWHFQDNRRSND